MSCVTHRCGDCGHQFFDNYRGGECPECGSWDVSDSFDEHEDETLVDYEPEEVERW